MFERKNLIDELLKLRRQMIQEDALMQQVSELLTRDEVKREAIKYRLGEEGGDDAFNNFTVSLLKPEKIFHISQIKRTCIAYRLRFLGSNMFKNPIPEAAVTDIKHLENLHETELKGFKIMAPSKAFHLKNYDDPLLFAPIGDGYYYLIHQWGRDLSPFRKMMVRPMRSFTSLLVFLTVTSALFTWLLTTLLFYGDNTGQFVLVAFLFTFKSLCGIALYYCFWKGKNFNNAIWNSTFYNK